MSTMSTDFEVTGASVEEIEANADKAAKKLAGDRSYTLEITHMYGTWNLGAKAQPAVPPSFSAHVAVELDGLPPSFRDQRADDRARVLW